MAGSASATACGGCLLCYDAGRRCLPKRGHPHTGAAEPRSCLTFLRHCCVGVPGCGALTMCGRGPGAGRWRVSTGLCDGAGGAAHSAAGGFAGDGGCGAAGELGSRRSPAGGAVTARRRAEAAGGGQRQRCQRGCARGGGGGGPQGQRAVPAAGGPARPCVAACSRPGAGAAGVLRPRPQRTAPAYTRTDAAVEFLLSIALWVGFVGSITEDQPHVAQADSRSGGHAVQE